jgi:Domain of unknown function (DUF4349)
MSPDTKIDERFDELVAALRAETPDTPANLRERVDEITVVQAAPRRFTARRFLAYAAPAAVGVSLAAALAVGLSSAIDGRPQTDAGSSAAPAPAVESARTREAEDAQTTAPSSGAAGEAYLAPATGGRAQDYRASLRLLVGGPGELSQATQEALRTTRSLGGYVVAVEYATPEPGEGTANAELRIPRTRVQAAIVEFSELGRILTQDTRIADLQAGLDEVTRQIRQLERRAAQARGAERQQLLAQIAALRRQRADTNRRAAFATVNLALTTHEPATAPAEESRAERAIGDALGILVAELVIVAYALIVASPLLLILAAWFFGNRAYRRHADQRLLERA